MRFAVLKNRAVRILAAAALVGASAFCAAQPPAASVLPLAPEVPNPSLVDGLRLPGSPIPPFEAPVQLFPVPLPEMAPRPVNAPDIVLVLPLDSPDYVRAAEAVRDGFIAAAHAADAARRVHVVGHADGAVMEAIDIAISLGALVIAGPLVRDDLRAVVESGRPLPLMLALNQLDSHEAMPPGMYTLSLSIESDARVLARTVRSRTTGTVAVIGGEGPLMRRFASAFTAEWLLSGGSPPQPIPFDASTDGLSILRKDIADSTAEAAIIALDGSTAVLARSFAPRMQAYTSSLVNQPWEPAALADLEGVVFVEIPWLVTPAEPALRRFPRPTMNNLVLDRLYALGLDAFLVAQRFTTGVPERMELQGATGRLSLGNSHHLSREGTLAVFRNGLVVPLDAPR